MNQIIYVGKHLITYSVTRHAHTSWELIYCTGGSGVIKTDLHTLPYETGDVIIMPPNVPHINHSQEGFTNIHINMIDPAFSLSQPTVIRSDSEGLLLNAFSAAFFHFSKPEHSIPFLSAYGDLICYYIASLQDGQEHSGVVEESINCIIRNYPDCPQGVQERDRPDASSVPDQQAAGDRRFLPVLGPDRPERLGDRASLRLPGAAVLLPCFQEGLRGVAQRIPGACLLYAAGAS